MRSRAAKKLSSVKGKAGSGQGNGKTEAFGTLTKSNSVSLLFYRSLPGVVFGELQILKETSTIHPTFVFCFISTAKNLFCE